MEDERYSVFGEDGEPRQVERTEGFQKDGAGSLDLRASIICLARKPEDHHHGMGQLDRKTMEAQSGQKASSTQSCSPVFTGQGFPKGWDFLMLVYFFKAL